jgi:tetratricopeptide (TPR) repeat protein
MTTLERLNWTNQLLLDGQIDRADQALLLVEPKTSAEKRMTAHYTALVAFARGNIQSAKEQLIKAQRDFGDNVNLFRDLAVCYYHQQDMLQFRACLDQLERTLVEQEGKLSPRTSLECELMLGKFLEEEARLAPALIFYEKALLRTQNTHQRLRVLLQKARWLALYEPASELSDLYRELISVPTDDITQDMGIEFEHSLMLIELRLIGSDHAWQRCLKLKSEVAEIDRRLMVFDFIEGCFSQDLPIPPLVLTMINQFKSFDPYEEYLKKLVQGQLEPQQKIQELNRLSAKLPWASYLRLLCLTANMEAQVSSKQELNRKIHLIIRGLDQKTQLLWNSRLKQALQSPEIRIEFCSRTRAVTIQGKTVDLSKKKVGQQILAILMKSPALTVDQFINHLWQTSFSPEHYHRLRMSIHRLNSLMNECSGLGKIIEVDSQEVRLRPEVKLRPADELDSTTFAIN